LALSQHLKALLERSNLPEARRLALVAGLQVSDPANVKAACQALADDHPGIEDRLTQLWVDSRSRAVHFFRLPILDGTTLGEAKRLVTENLDAANAIDRWHKFRRPKERIPHLQLVRLGQRELNLRARLYLERHSQLDDDVNSYLVHRDVDCRIEFSRQGGAIAEVYGTTAYARAGLRTCLEELLLEEIPKKRSAKQEKYMLPLRFSEGHVKSVATDLGLKVTLLDGPDPQDSIGGVSLYGKQRGVVRDPLPLDDPRVKIRERAGNDQRVYLYDYDHGDGYTEQAEVRFNLHAQHPHVTFTKISSRLAMRWILDALLSKVAH